MPDDKPSRVRDGASDRKFGEAPILGKVPRSPGSAVRGRDGNVVRKKRRKKLSIAVLVWTCLIAFVSVCVLAVVIVAYFRKQAMAAGNSGNLPGLAAAFDSAFPDAVPATLPTLGHEEALRIVRSALANTDPALVADHFVLGEVSDPAAALRELALIRENEGAVREMQWIGEKFFNGGNCGEVVVFLENDERKGNRLAQLMPGGDGKWRIDLDSYLRKVSPGWDDILSGKSETSLVRIFLAADVYYNGIYADESAWSAYALASPDVTDILYAYAKRGSSQDKALQYILASEEPIRRATLRLRKQPESGARQFEISRVVAENWVVGEADFDEMF